MNSVHIGGIWESAELSSFRDRYLLPLAKGKIKMHTDTFLHMKPGLSKFS